MIDNGHSHKLPLDRTSVHSISCNRMFCPTTWLHPWSLLKGAWGIYRKGRKSYPEGLDWDSEHCGKWWWKTRSAWTCGNLNNFGIPRESLYSNHPSKVLLDLPLSTFVKYCIGLLVCHDLWGCPRDFIIFIKFLIFPSFQGFQGFCGQHSEKVSRKIDIGFEVSRFPRFLEVSWGFWGFENFGNLFIIFLMTCTWVGQHKRTKPYEGL